MLSAAIPDSETGGWGPVWSATGPAYEQMMGCSGNPLCTVARRVLCCGVHVIVVGCGRVGSGLAISLVSQGHSVAIMDKNPGAFRRLKEWEGPRIVGSGFDRDDLEKAGAIGADALAAV